MLRARLAYFNVFKVSSVFESAGLTQAAWENEDKLVEEHETKESVVKKAEASLYVKGSLQVTHQS